jgi:hypothetical protein
VEPSRERIEDLMSRYGYQKEEAEIAYHLIEARNRLTKMFEDETEEEAVEETGGFEILFTHIRLMSQVYPHFYALHSLLDRRVLARDRPEGWGSRPAPEEEG